MSVSMFDMGRLGMTCRPIDSWPGELTKSYQRKRAPFRAAWSRTAGELAKELAAIRAKRIVLQLAITEGEIVNDGSRPRADARPTHPGVILSFECKHGPMRIACDRFTHWDDNIRAIALGLSDLRRLERYGITRRGEQYRGWRALPGGDGAASNGEAMTIEQAAAFVCLVAGERGRVEGDCGDYRELYRKAASRCHPDVGGDEKVFVKLQKAKAVLDQHHGLK